MAQQTNPALNSLIIYELSVMNLTEKHNFDGVIDELDRIRDLGVDVVWLMPIHPRGEKMKFGECGSPYSVRDFRAINPAYGDFDSFGRLVKEIHARGMKVMLDIVYNHTSQDSALLERRLRSGLFQRSALRLHGRNRADVGKAWRGRLPLRRGPDGAPEFLEPCACGDGQDQSRFHLAGGNPSLSLPDQDARPRLESAQRRGDVSGV